MAVADFQAVIGVLETEPDGVSLKSTHAPDIRSMAATNGSGTCGIVDADFVATVDFNNNHIEGTWHNTDTNTDVPFSLDREPCRKKRGDDYVPAPPLTWTRTDLTPTNVQYNAPAPAGSPGIDLIADVTGKVSGVFPAGNGQPLQITVDLPDGNALAYNVYGDGSAALVKAGDAVTPATPIATLNPVAAQTTYLFLVAGFLPNTSDKLSPDCIEQASP